MNDSTTTKVLCCPTAFKGSLGALQVAAAMALGADEVMGRGSAILLPLSDGGPGLIDALTHSASAAPELSSTEVEGPLGAPAAVRLLTLAGATVIESADATGLHLMVPADRDPLLASSRGVGEAIKAAVGRATGSIVVGLGGSATVDGGTGMARVFGYRFLDSSGAELPEGGGALADLAAIEPGDPPDVDVAALADVRSHLCGPDGAAYRFSAQKGATPAEVERLEAGLSQLSEIISRDLGVDVADLEGAGAAGGLGAGCVAFLGAGLRPGADWVMEQVGFDRFLEDCDLVVTGEGAWDSTSGLGKVVYEVSRRSAEAGKPLLLACGRLDGVSSEPGLVAVDGGGAWLDEKGLARVVATALREHGGRLQGPGGPV